MTEDNSLDGCVSGFASSPQVIAIVGPTAVGKSRLAIELARKIGAEIINADSRLLYRGLDIGTAKPSVEQMSSVTHHLIDIIDASDIFSLAEYLERARALIKEIRARDRTAIVVGGSGQYVTALLDGWRVPRVPPNAILRAKLERLAANDGVHSVHALLVREHPEAAAKIDARNIRRVIRALEVCRTQVRSDDVLAEPIHATIIGLTAPRGELYRRADLRVSDMIERGWIKEVSQLLDSGISAASPAFSAIGYRDLAAYIQGDFPIDEALRRIRSATRRLIRHQFNWFSLEDVRIAWLSVGPDLVQRTMNSL